MGSIGSGLRNCSTLITLPLIFVFVQPARFATAQEKQVIIGYVARDLNGFPPLLAEAKGFGVRLGDFMLMN